MKGRAAVIILSLLLALTLGGCRTRVVAPEPESVRQTEQAREREESAPPPAGGDVAPETPDTDEETAPEDDAERREYDSDASGELADDAETPLYAPAEQPAEAVVAAADGAGGPANVESGAAELTATETVPAEEAEQLGAGEDGAVADSMLTYYTTLLSDRVGPLFECKRLYVYWETAADHTTVYKDSPEHRMIVDAGAYDVSAKLLAENLMVDDGWVSRKNPDAVVKVADGGALDVGAARALCDALAARSEWGGVGAMRDGRVLVLSQRLLDTQAGRTAAMVYLAKLLYPDQMSDVDADEALRALTREATGSAYSGTYAYYM